MIQYKKGNILLDEAKVLVNTVNLAGVMGKDVALAFKQAFPNNFTVYAEACRNRSLTIGKLCILMDHSISFGDKTIINLPTKTHWRYPSEYAYVALGLAALREYLLEACPKQIAMPALGCGNGGLDWRQVKPMIEKQLSGVDCIITVYEPQQ